MVYCLRANVPGFDCLFRKSGENYQIDIDLEQPLALEFSTSAVAFREPLD